MQVYLHTLSTTILVHGDCLQRWQLNQCFCVPYLRHFFANIFPLWLTKFNLDFVRFHTNNVNPNLQTNNWMKIKTASRCIFPPFVWFCLFDKCNVWLWLSLWIKTCEYFFLPLLCQIYFIGHSHVGGCNICLKERTSNNCHTEYIASLDKLREKERERE